MNFVSVFRLVAERQPDQLAIVMGDRRVTYAELIQQAQHVAGGLRATGLHRGDRVLIFSDNRPEYLVALFAAAQLGAITAMANPALQKEEMSFVLESSRPQCVIVEPQLRGVLEAAMRFSGQSPRVLELAPESSDHGFGFGDLPSADPVEADAAVEDGEGLLISYTSGTSSQPKAVFHSHGGLAFAARTHAAMWHLGPDDRVLVALPLAWMYGMATITHSALAAGATAVLLRHFNPIAALDEFVRNKITVFAGVTTMFIKLVQLSGPGDATESHLRLCLSGGEPRNEPAFARFRQRFGVPIHDIYALSECLPLLALDPQRDPEPRPGSAGRLAPGVQARILDPEGREVGVGTLGELFARSPGQMLGYYNDPVRTAEVIVDGWFRTRDLFFEDDEGYFYMAGRTTDLINRGGAKISPLEVENVLARHSAVAEAAVIGAPDPEYGQRIVAFVVPNPGASVTAAELVAHCAGILAPFKVPSEVQFLPELPKAETTGKTRRAMLAGRLGETSPSDSRKPS
jgi:long-chain acyl-CoA synthetase